MRQRDFLMSTSAMSCPSCADLASHRTFGSKKSSPWSYSAEEGPSHWGWLTSDYAACSGGSEQLPIDPAGAIQAEIAPADITWQAIEPVIGHLKAEHRLDRNRLKGREGDCANAILTAAGYNFHLLLRRLQALLRASFQVLPATRTDSAYAS